MPSYAALRRLSILFALTASRAGFAVSCLPPTAPPLHRGYYSDPALHGDTIVFTSSEGDLWSVVHSRRRRRTGSPPAQAQRARPPSLPTERLSPSAPTTKGPSEVYTMPIDGGLPQRRTWDGTPSPRAGRPTDACWRPLSATPRCPARSWCSSTTRAGARWCRLPRPRRALLLRRPHTLFHALVFAASGARPSATRAARPKTSGASTARMKRFH
jgi:hypothetical protein